MRPDAGGYQAKWLMNVTNVVRNQGWDGVIIDNANVTCPGGTCDEYPTQASYQQATRSWLQNVAAVLPGFTVANIQHHGSLMNEAIWADWLQFLDGGHLEHYTKWGAGTDQHIMGSGWESSGQVFMKASQAAGQPFLGTFSCPMTDTRSMLYARGSFLIDWDGVSESALLLDPNPLSQDPWSSVWTKDMGQPLGPKVAVGTSWERQFEKGKVTVNPTNGTAVIG
jgi:hypothetical protein